MTEIQAITLIPMDGSYDHVRKTIHGTLRERSIEPITLGQQAKFDATWANAATQAIQEAGLVVADVTQNEPNVLYELGFAHGLRKPTILLHNIESGQEIPSDLAGYQILFYDPDDLVSMRHRISRFLDSFLDHQLLR